jgi:C-terminal processing protease CtpA/Prc
VQTIAPLRVSLEKDKDGNYLPNAIRLTTAKYYTPDNTGPEGKSIDGGIGIAPDVTVELRKDQEGDLLTKGMLLGDPPYTKPGEEKEKTVKKDGETKNEDETESKENTEEEQKTDEDKNLQERDEPGPTPTPAVEENDEKAKDKTPVNKDKKEDDKSKPGAGKDDKPFYLKSKDTTPTTNDIQLRYAVDLLKALLIVRHEQ